MRDPLNRDDLTMLFFYSVMACILTVPLSDWTGAIKENTKTYQAYFDSCTMPQTLPPKPTGNFWKLKWVDTRKEKR